MGPSGVNFCAGLKGHPVSEIGGYFVSDEPAQRSYFSRKYLVLQTVFLWDYRKQRPQYLSEMVATLLGRSARLPQVNFYLDLTTLKTFLRQRNSAQAAAPSGP